MPPSLTTYMRSLASEPPIPREEEERLAREYVQLGSALAGERLVRANLRLVVKIAQEFRWSGHDLLDLIEEGNLGLVIGLRKFDPERGVRLSSYAAWWIRALILRYVTLNRRLVRIGTTFAQRRVMARLRAERARFERVGIHPDAEMLAGALGVRAEGLAELEQHMDGGEVALDAPVGGDDQHLTRLAALASGEDARPDAQYERAERADALARTTRAFLGTLDERDRRLFRERWLAEEQPTLQEMGHRFGVSRERARQLEARLLERFRDFAGERLAG